MKHPHLITRLAAGTICLALICARAACGGSTAADHFSAAPAAAEQATGGETENYDASLTDVKAQSDRKLIVNAELWLDATDFEAAAAEIERQVTALGGYLASSNQDGAAGTANRSARYEARIPAEKLSSFLDSAGKAGAVVSSSQSTTDVTAEYVDNEARLASLRTQEQRLLELMAQAAKLEDLITLEDKLTEVRYQIESLTGQQKLYDNQVEYATVSVIVNEVTRETITAPTFGDRILRAFQGSLDNVVELAQELVILFIYLLPLLLLIAVVLTAVLLSLRAARRRRAKRPAATQPPADIPPAAGDRGPGRQ